MALALLATFAFLYVLMAVAADSCSTLRHVLAARVAINVAICIGLGRGGEALFQRIAQRHAIFKSRG